LCNHVPQICSSFLAQFLYHICLLTVQTSLEQKIYGAIDDLKLPFRLYAQHPVSVPGNAQPYLLDFAFPDLGLAIEADGAAWHQEVTKKAKDAGRDNTLAQVGWTVLRFNEAAIEDRINDVKKSILGYVQSAFNRKKSNKKQASTGSKAIGFISKDDFMKLSAQNVKYEHKVMSNGLGDIMILGA